MIYKLFLQSNKHLEICLHPTYWSFIDLQVWGIRQMLVGCVKNQFFCQINSPKLVMDVNI